jgi:MFS family permease
VGSRRTPLGKFPKIAFLRSCRCNVNLANLISAYNGAISAGAVAGALFSSWFSTWAGRKRSIQLECVISVVGGALGAGSVAPGVFIVARLISGLGTGILVTVIPMYQSEVATPETRGFMTCMQGVMFAVGYSLVGWIGYGCYLTSKTSSFGFRFPLAFQCVPPLIVLTASPFLSFSPRWLLQQNRHEEALAVLKRLHISKEDPMGHAAKQEFYQT